MQSMSPMSDRLRKAREAAGYGSAYEAAEAMRTPKGTYSCHENGSRGFYNELVRYAHFFKVRVEWLLAGNGPMKAGQKPRILELYEGLASEKQPAALDFLEYLHRDGR